MPDWKTEPSFLEPLLGIVFDLDGTLIISHHDFLRMRREVVRLAERYGVTPGHLSVEEPIHRILEAAREEIRTSGAPDGLLFRFEAEFHKLIDGIEMEALPRTQARPGATELLRGLTDRGFRLGILTRSSELFCRQALARTHLAPYFTNIRTRTMPGPTKPSPEALRLLLEEMGVPVDRALYVGDHILDAECATGASVRFYAVLPDPSDNLSMTADRMVAAGAKAVAKDLTELGRQLAAAPSLAAGAPT